MLPKPRVSVVVPTYNRAHVLDTCLRTVLAQANGQPYEVVVVDDGSTDGTREVVDQAKTLDGGDRISYIHQQRSGLNAARNHGVRESSGELIMFVDDDVDAPTGWLNALVAANDRHPDVDCFGGPIILRIEGRGPRTCSYESLATELEYEPVERPVERVWGANMAMRRRAFDAIGPFHEEIPGPGDEEHWIIRLLDSGGTVMYVPDAWLWHRRVGTDLRLWPLMRTRYKRGFNQVPFYRWAGWPMSQSSELGHALVWLGHAVRRRCSGGLLMVATCLGRISGLRKNHKQLSPTREARNTIPTDSGPTLHA